MSQEPGFPPPAGRPPGDRGGAPRRRVRWGLPDALLVWVAAGILGGLAQIPVADRAFADVDPIYKFGVLLPAQQLPVLLGLLLVSKAKGRGSLRADFGLEVRSSDLRVFWIGPALQVLFLVMLVPLSWIGGELEQQQLIEDIEESRSVPALLLFTLGAVIMAPIVEEALYRGLLLRALLRRVTAGPAVFVSAMIFAGVHLLGDPNALRSLPALAALGIVLGVVAVHTGSLSRPILLHAGFNLTTVVLVALPA